MRVVKALDAGPMLASVAPSDRSRRDERRGRARSRAHRRRACSSPIVDRSPAGPSRETPQDDAAATYAHRLTKDDGVDRLDAAGARIHNLIRGLHPWPHAFTLRRRQAADPAAVDVSRPTAGRSTPARRAPSSRPTATRSASPPATACSRIARDPGRGQAADDGPRVPRRPSARAPAIVLGRAMIAPARVAAYDILRAVVGRTRRPADRDRRHARDAARRSRSRARRRNRHRRPALARRARSPDRRTSPSGAIDRLDPEIVEILRLSAYQLLHLTRVPAAAVVDDAVDLTRRRGQDAARAASSTRCCGRSRASARRCRCRRGRPIRATATPRSTT